MASTSLEVALSSCDLETVWWFLLTDSSALCLGNYKKVLELLFVCFPTTRDRPLLWSDIFHYLLDHGAQSGYFIAGLQMPDNALQFGNVENLKKLLCVGFTVGTSNCPVDAYNLHLALFNEDEYVLNHLIIDLGGHIDSIDSEGRTLLHVAVTNLWYRKTKQLLRLGADPNLHHRNKPPLVMVIEKNSFVIHKIFTYLLHRSSLATICATMQHARDRLLKQHVLKLLEYAVLYFGIDETHPSLLPVFAEVVHEEVFAIADQDYRQYLIQCVAEVRCYQQTLLSEHTSVYTMLKQFLEKNYSALKDESIRAFFQQLPKFLNQHRSSIYGKLLEHNYAKAIRYVETEQKGFKCLGRIVGLAPENYFFIIRNILKFLPRHEIKRLPEFSEGSQEGH